MKTLSIVFGAIENGHAASWDIAIIVICVIALIVLCIVLPDTNKPSKK